VVSRARNASKAAALIALLLAFAQPARAAPPAIVIEADLAPARVYVGVEARLTLRLLRAPGAPRGALVPPELGDAADLTPLGPVQIARAVRAGAAYEAIERTFAVVPRRPGRLVLPGAEFEPALGEPYFGARGPRRVLDARPIPPGAVEPWLPARNLTLEETWSRDPGALAAGEPVTRTLVLRAEGLPAARLPRLDMPRFPSLEVRYDLPELATERSAEGSTGLLVQRIVLVPEADASVTLPPLTIDWWDLDADAPRSATIPARTLRLRPAPVAEAPPESAPLLSDRAALGWTVAAILVLAGGFLAWQLRRQNLRDARARLREACRRSDPRAARDALREWWKLARGSRPPLLQGMGAGWDRSAGEQLAALDAALYAGRAWDGEALWRSARPWLGARRARREAPAAQRPSLFRLQARAARQRTAAARK
jgi:hypothetical protein